jgi:hypothetical protein
MMEKLHQNWTHEGSRKLRELHDSGKAFNIQANSGDFKNGDLEGYEALDLEIIVGQDTSAAETNWLRFCTSNDSIGE